MLRSEPFPVHQRQRRPFSLAEALNRLPDTFRGSFAAGELRHDFDAGQAVPDLNESLGAGSDQVGELFFGREDGSAGFAGCLAGSVGGDVVFCVNRKSLHLALILFVQ